MRTTTFVALACLAVAACDSPAERRQLAAMDAVRGQLRDPASATFSDAWSSGSAVCGRVNSRNGFGGMTGARRFIVLDAGDVVLEERYRPAFFASFWRETGCGQ